MVRTLSSQNATALAARRLIPRDFIWVEARDLETGDIVADGQWSDIGPITCDVINPNTGGSVSRTFFGSGTLTRVSDIILSSTISAQPATITMSQVHDRVEALLRGYDVKQAPVQIHRGLLDIDTRQLVAPAFCRFLGYVDQVKFNTPEEGADGSVTLTCNSHTQEMMRSNPDLRSHESQQLRLIGDAFYQDVQVVPMWEHFWGKQSGKVSTSGGVSAADAERARQLIGAVF